MKKVLKQAFDKVQEKAKEMKAKMEKAKSNIKEQVEKVTEPKK